MEKETNINQEGSQSAIFEKVGIGLSVLCAIHCLMMPLLVGVLPLLGLSFLADEPTEHILSLTVVVFALGSCLWGFKKHRELRILMSFVAGISIFTLGFLLEKTTAMGKWISVLGVILIVGSHYFSVKLSRNCHDKEKPCCQ